MVQNHNQNVLKTDSYIIKLNQNGPKLQKVGKKFQKFQKISINSKKFKNYISFETFYPFELRTSNTNFGSFVRQNSTPLVPGNSSCRPLPFSCKFYQFPWSIFYFQANLDQSSRPMQKSGFFPRIGLAIRGKTAQTRIHTRLFCKQSRMRLHT